MPCYLSSFCVSTCLAFAVAITSAQSAPVFMDPLDDTFGDGQFRPDISLLDSRVSETDVTFRVQFHNDISPPSALAVNSVVGFIDIDVDQSFETGQTSNQSTFSPAGSSGIGMEFYVDLFSEQFSPGFAEVLDASTVTVVGSVPIRFGSRELSVTLPLGLLGPDDGRVNYGVIVGDFISHGDEATNFGEGVAYTVAEPTSTVLAGLCVVAVLFVRRKSRVQRHGDELSRTWR